MIVGHLPFLDKLASALLCGNENQKVVSFQYGCIVKLVRNDETKAWSIKWMVIPDIC
jgi:phosphohistidine phosphatase